MEALVGFQGREVGDVVQLDFCHPSSSNPLFFNGLKNELRASGNIEA